MQLVAEHCCNCHYPTGKSQSGCKFRNRMNQKEFISMIFPNINLSQLLVSCYFSCSVPHTCKSKKSVSDNEQKFQESCSMFFQGTCLSCSSSACTAPALASFLSTKNKQCSCFPAWPLPGDDIVLITTHSCHQPKRNLQSYKQNFSN